MNGAWKQVSRHEPCPVCGHDSWCMVSADGAVCLCHRRESDRQVRSGNGWLHRIGRESGQWKTECGESTGHPPPTTAPSAYFAALPQGDVQVRLCRYLMRELSLPSAILIAMDVRWDARAKAVAFPMRDAGGNVTGIRYRQLKTGRKWAYRGSKDGLFYVPELLPVFSGEDWMEEAKKIDPHFADYREPVVCEGPTDAAAALACGIPAVGRSSCGTGAALLKELFRNRRAMRVTIVADDDKPKARPDGTTWRPGVDGALALAKTLRMPCRIVLPPPGFKDLREWYAKGGLTEEKFRIAQASAAWED